MYFRFCNNNNNNPPARITAQEATEQKLNILLEWPNEERKNNRKWHFHYRTLLHLAVFHVAFGHLYESC